MSTSCVCSCFKERRCICATGPIARLSSSRPTRASPVTSTSSASPGPICTPTSEMQAYSPSVCLSVRFLPVCLSIRVARALGLWASIYVFCVSSCLHAFSLSLSPSPIPSSGSLSVPSASGRPLDSIRLHLLDPLANTYIHMLSPTPRLLRKKKKTAGDPNENDDEDKKELNQDHVEQKSRVES